MQQLKLLTLALLTFSIQTNGQAFSDYARPLAGYLPHLPQVPEGNFQDTLLHFCTNHGVADSLYYQYDSVGRIQAYSSVYPSRSGLIYAEHRLSYTKGKLQNWERLPDQTNNGLSYHLTYDSLNFFKSMEVVNTSLYGSYFRYSVEMLVRNAHQEKYRFDYQDGSFSIRIDFRTPGKDFDSSWVFENGELNPSKKFRYRSIIQGTHKTVYQKKYSLNRVYYGHWVYNPGYEPGMWATHLPTKTRRYLQIPAPSGIGKFAIDSIVMEEKPYESITYTYQKFKNYQLTAFQSNNGQPIEQRQFTYDSIGALLSEDFRDQYDNGKWNWSFLNPKQSDTGSFYSSYYVNSVYGLNIWSCWGGTLGGYPSEVTQVFNVYPNPSEGLLNIDFPRNRAQLKIVDLKGCLWWEGQLDATDPALNLSHLPKGVYVLLLESAGQFQTTQWIKMD